MCKTLLIALFALLLLAAQPAPKDKPKPKAPPTPPAAAVSIKDRKFTPETLTIKKGQTVTWTNNDDLDHTVNANDGSFSSGTLKKRGAFQHTFKTAGKFPYNCKLHPREKGTIVVE